jgi:CBS domain-containing protein
MVTDRDIVCRLIAAGKNPLEATVKECMSSPAVAVKPEDSVDHVANVMESKQIRRIPVVDETGAVVGLVTQAHIAKNTSESQAGELLKSISRKSSEPSKVGARS